MKKYVILVLAILMGGGSYMFAQGEEHSISFNKPDTFAANLLIWISVAVVVFTLILTIKFLVDPKEDNPDHIKNIVKDEGF